MNESNVIAVSIASVAIVIIVCFASGYHRNLAYEAEIAKAAAAAGLVQQVVVPARERSITIWVKPPAPSMIETQ